ncbi:MAG: hypothetical protein A4E55_00825 [Pelotomaculum sp. PtaU1.Bin035]|nr:MAG: hypothetical protein A4E55_00825 [Pelotomaculum sp. PtaU1.Bin035]
MKQNDSVITHSVFFKFSGVLLISPANKYLTTNSEMFMILDEEA